MNTVGDWKSAVLEATGACGAERGERIQSLWSGYGEIVRVNLLGSDIASVVLKAIELPVSMVHPRGWESDISHQRKVRSYDVERSWYREYANQCDDLCRIPHCFGTYVSSHKQWIVLEDLDRSGFGARRQFLTVEDAGLCLQWLAFFHAKFLRNKGVGLWEQGTYWHLQTRPDELASMSDTALKAAAPSLDAALANCRYQTLVHGDAKLANFCFSQNMRKVAAVDFQYVGRGCGMKDVVYFLGSCLDEADCECFEAELLQVYFTALEQALAKYNSNVDIADLETEWRGLYCVAWTDFYRFLQGWSPVHGKINRYTKALAERALKALI